METQNEKETRLQIIVRQCAEKVERAIIQEVQDGAKVKKMCGGIDIEGIFLHKCTTPDDYCMVVLRLNSSDIMNLFKPDKEALEKRADELRKELKEIENKLKSK